MKLRSFIIAFVALFFLTFQALGIVHFAQFSDPHIFEDAKREQEAKTSAKDFQEMVKQLKEPLDFVVVTGDLGVGKLLMVDPKTGMHQKNPATWSKAVETLGQILKDSSVKKWFFVPGNNDLFEEEPETVRFYQDFLKELQERPEVKGAGLSIVDFRLEASQKAQKGSPPGMYTLQNFVFVGWDNSYFKNNNSVKHYTDKQGNLIPYGKTLEYKSVQKLASALKQSQAKYAYLFYHIPDIDDPYLILDDDSKAKEIVAKRMKEAEALSPDFAKGLYPYSAWTVPLEVRQAWEQTITGNSGKGPLVKGLFAGHFHDHKKTVYLTTSWVKSQKYKPEILKNLYLAPPVSLKLQTNYPPSQQARGYQIVTIDDAGDVSRKGVWMN